MQYVSYIPYVTAVVYAQHGVNFACSLNLVMKIKIYEHNAKKKHSDIRQID